MERYPEMDSDIVSTCREKLQKFIRELHRLTIYVKILKMLNPFTTPPQKYFNNEEVSGLNSIALSL